MTGLKSDKTDVLVDKYLVFLLLFHNYILIFDQSTPQTSFSFTLNHSMRHVDPLYTSTLHTGSPSSIL